MRINKADVAELVDARDLKSLDGNVVWVRVPPPAPSKNAFRATGPRRRNATRRRPQYLRRPVHARLWLAGRSVAGYGNRTGTDLGYRCWGSCNAVSRARTRHRKRESDAHSGFDDF